MMDEFARVGPLPRMQHFNTMDQSEYHTGHGLSHSNSMHFASSIGDIRHVQHLTIVSHKTHAEETVVKGGVEKTVHVVVKGSPFYFTIGSVDPNFRVDFSQIAFEASLVYDCPGDKEVDFVRAKPLEFKPTATNGGHNLETEIRIKILSSQHEDMSFRVKIRGTNPITKEDMPGVSILTPPIKVISKPEQIKKREPSRKRTMTETLLDTISRIEKVQEEQAHLIEQIISQKQREQERNDEGSMMNAIPLENNPHHHTWTRIYSDIPVMDNSVNNNNAVQPLQPANVSFEDAFNNLIKTFQGLEGAEKTETVKQLLAESSIPKISEMLDLFWSEGLQKEPPAEYTAGSDYDLYGRLNGCSCVNCPHKSELERINAYYTEFLASSVPQPSGPSFFS